MNDENSNEKKYYNNWKKDQEIIMIQTFTNKNSTRFHVSRPRGKKKANDFTNRIIQQFPLPSRFRFESLTFTRRIHF